jgi:hypothetical protein
MPVVKIVRNAEQHRKRSRDIVRNVRSQGTLDQAIEIVLSSGWDFDDRRGILYGDPQYHRRYLQSLLQERARALQELAPPRQRLFCAIIDAWLAWELFQ